MKNVIQNNKNTHNLNNTYDFEQCPDNETIYNKFKNLSMDPIKFHETSRRVAQIPKTNKYKSISFSPAMKSVLNNTVD